MRSSGKFGKNGAPEKIDPEINLTWLHSSDNEPIDIREKYLYSNARYLMFRFETITNNIETTANENNTEGGNIVTGYDVKANYSINILCENFLYRNDGIQKVNGIKANHLRIISSDNTIIQSTTLEDPSENSLDDTVITVDLKTNIKSNDNSIEITKPSSKNKYWNLKNPLRINGDEYISASLANNIYDISFNDDTLQKISYIEKLPTSINNLKEAHNKIYWSTELSPDIIWEDNVWLNAIPAKSITFNLFYKPSETCKFKNSKNIIWTMLSGQESPDFIAGRIYYITFRIVPPIEGFFEQETCFARINWFANI